MNGILVMWDQYLITNLLTVNVGSFGKGGGITMKRIFGWSETIGFDRFEKENGKRHGVISMKPFEIVKYVWQS